MSLYWWCLCEENTKVNVGCSTWWSRASTRWRCGFQPCVNANGRHSVVAIGHFDGRRPLFGFVNARKSHCDWATRSGIGNSLYVILNLCHKWLYVDLSLHTIYPCTNNIDMTIKNAISVHIYSIFTMFIHYSEKCKSITS